MNNVEELKTFLKRGVMYFLEECLEGECVLGVGNYLWPAKVICVTLFFFQV